MKEFFCVLLLLGSFAALCQGKDLLVCAKKCTGQGQKCVVKNHNQAVCQCRESCPRPRHHERVCGSDGITYPSRCMLDMTSCKLGLTYLTVDQNRCKERLRVSSAHKSKQTLRSGRRGAIHCEIEGKAAQILWTKDGMKHRLPYGRVLSSNSKTLRFRRVHLEDAGTYKCRAYSGSSIVVATVTVVITDPSKVDTNVASPHVCHLEQLIGTGTNFSARWYFDGKNGVCQPFLYSGVGGNENNFESKILCLRKCSHAAGDVCSLPKRPGRCMAYIPRWYYDTNKGRCQRFIYGGCRGNANNFNTKDECEKTCSASRICSLAPAPGPCKAYMPRYFYNQTSGQCDKFIYGGCQGNSNNFPTLEICQKKCERASNLTPKGKKEKPGSCPWVIQGTPVICVRSEDFCQSDEECDDDKKCCETGCGKSCTMAITTNKPGKCPRVPHDDKDCDKRGDMCDRDTDCPGNRKCCFNGCQRDCSVPEAPKRIKPGVCPAVNAINPTLCKTTKNECKMDDDCFGLLKCCFNGCFSECMKRPQPRPKPGSCPIADFIPPENCSDTEDKCIDDTQCPGRDKCCATGCLQKCVTPSAETKPGMCPIVDYISPENCDVTEDECEEDVDCKGRDKCCATGCIKECITSPIEVKPGECPLADYISPELCNVFEDECEYDNDCKGRDKCCATSCIKECVTPPEGRPDVNRTLLVGRCPKPWKGLDGICDRRGDMCYDDSHCNESTKCCFNGCQKDCIEPVSFSKVGFCPKPWKGQGGICDRRGDMCSVDVDCEKSEKCCYNGCQRDCVKRTTREWSQKPGYCPNPWREQPCDRRGDMCDTDNDCGNSTGSKCCDNGCQKDCVKPVNLTKCQTETQEALDKLALDPPLLGVFVPRCKPDGQYEDQQCHELSCWCVDKDGIKIPHTTVRGSAVCLPQDKYGKCPRPWKGQDGICDYRGDMCLQDSDCSGHNRCCFNGCQNDCVSPVGIQLCKKHKEANAAADSEPPLVGAFVPSCKLNGDYEEIQCHGSTEYCWCVDKFGDELQGTRIRGEPNCTHPALSVGAGKDGTCPKPWKGLTGFCDKMGDECGMDYHCSENEKCCFSGCQRLCVNTTEAHKKADTKPGHCPKPWLGREGLCNRRGDMCSKDVDCQGSQICCFNGCQKDCVNPGLSTCQKRYEESFLFPRLGRFVPHCKDDGRFHERQCHPSTGHCWCVDSYGTELLGTRTRGRPHCTVADPCISSPCPYYGHCVPSADRKSVECKCNIACPFIYDPVCGTDGNTYANECVMKSTACVQKKSITVDYTGECEEVDPCASLKCGFYSECDVINGGVTCVCPGSGSRPSCGNEKEPVCGSDGQIYDNICHLMNVSCVQEMMIIPSLPEKCGDPCNNITCSHPLMACTVSEEGRPGCECPLIHCIREYDPVCGTDGETYPNSCIMDSQSCQEGKIVSVDYQGKCNKSKEIAGLVSGVAVEDPCSKVNCSHPFAACEVINGTATCACPVVSIQQYAPVCGSDGETYPHLGALNIASCNSGGAVQKAKDGECSTIFDPCKINFCSDKRHRCEVQNGTAVCICNTACTLEHAPVCASNNETYPNKCTMEVAACQSGERLRVLRPGRCGGITRSKPDICPSPWKSLDGICDRRGDMCQSNADCEKQGGKCCFNGCQNDCVRLGEITCPQKCHPNGQCIELVFGGRQCVCNPGFEGDGTECAADPCSVKKCDHYAQCTNSGGVGECVCPQACPEYHAPVCGSDGNVYDNECFMRAASCKQQKKITLTSKETCKPDPCKKSKCSHPQHTCIEKSFGAVCVCPPTPCTREYVLVCGSDGNTYPNSCVLKATACESSQNITLASQGECKTNNTNPCDVPSLCTHPYHQCELVAGSKAVCVCPMIIPAHLAPVCGSDGQTYPNSKALESMSCLANRIVDVQYEGECIVPTDPCDISLCSHSQHQCKVVDGMATCVCNELCPLILLPVCGSDGQTYPNDCTLEVEACVTGKELSVVAMGECDQCENKVCPHPKQYCRVVNGAASCVCNEICTSDWSPVNGSDGKTYPNECSLEVEACKTGTNLWKVKPVKRLSCPLIDPMPGCAPPSKPNCFTGGPKCPAGKACCLDHDCTHKCVVPAVSDGSRPGECPVLNPTTVCASVNGCESDSICNLGEKCCLQSGCTKKCVRALIRAVPPEPTQGRHVSFISVERMHSSEKSGTSNCNPPCHRYGYCEKGYGKYSCSCDRVCPRIYSPVCGTDGLTYGSECMRMYLVCQKGTDVELKHPGKCREEKQEDHCPVLNLTPVCASITGCSGDSECQDGEKCCLLRGCVRACIGKSKPGQCPVIKRKPCPLVIKPDKCNTDWDCAGELKCCSDGCTKECFSMFLLKRGALKNPCEFALCSYPRPVCKAVGKKAICKCRQNCPRHYDPVCASNGETYNNMCLLEKTACFLEDRGMPAGQLTYLANGNCTVAQICSLPPETGRCRASMKRFFFNATSRKCEVFRFGGCEGNANRFDSKKECHDYCGSLNACDLKPCPDPYAFCSPSVSGERKCSCPQICTADYSPVCGTDGKTYSNECQIRVAACSQGMMIKVKSRGRCEHNPGFCPPVDPRVCSDDREDECFDDASCDDDEKCCYDGCKKNCIKALSVQKPGRPRPVRPGVVPRTLGKVPHAEDSCKKCKFPRTFCSRDENGEAECLCPQVCTEEFAPVCGSDGRNYSNKCQLQVEACKPGNIRTLKVKHLGACVCDLPPVGGPCFGYIPRYFFNAATKRCERFIYGGCQGNDNNFETVQSCENKCISPCKNYKCSHPRTRCEVEEGVPTCKCPIICTADYRPVCGTDGKTYANMCALEAAACQTRHFKLELKHLGECLSVNPCEGFVCSHHRHRCVVKNNKAVCVCDKVCTGEYADPYCASDNKTYSSNCTLQIAECESGIALTIVHPGPCTERSDDPCVSVNCPFHGVCQISENGIPVCECVTECPDIYDPVCGSDRKNYSSECVLKSQACQTKTEVHVLGGPAKCASSRLKCNSCPPRSHLLTHFCESDFVIEGTLEEIRNTKEGDSLLMVKVTTMFKGPDSIQNKIIKIKFAENLNSCFCKELRLKKALIITGSTTAEGQHFLDKSSSFVRHAGRRLFEKVQQRTKHSKCNKIKSKKGD